MKVIITESQYNSLVFKRRYYEIKRLIDNLSDNPYLYYDEDEFYNDVKDLVYKNVFLGKRENLSWNDFDRDDLMLFIDEYLQDYIREKYRDANNW